MTETIRKVQFKMTESLFYKNAAIYWSKVPATIDGVLGGYGYISDTDIDGSKLFLNEILSSERPPATKLALDCGAGIGRVSKYVLMPRFDKVDLVEQDEKFLNTAKEFIGKENHDKIGTLYNVGLQNFKPEKKYDVIWCQWVLGHLKDFDLIDFMERCRNSLNKNGVLIVKENIATGDELEYDEDDSSVTRPEALLKTLINEAKFDITKIEVQQGFPDHIYPVHSFALVPRPDKSQTQFVFV